MFDRLDNHDFYILKAKPFENIVGKGENAGDPAFSPFPIMFSTGFLPWAAKSQDCVVMSYIQNDHMYKPFPKRQILDSSKLNELADNNFEYHENGRMFSKKGRKHSGKEEIACYEQFLLFPYCFEKTYTSDT